MSSVEKRNRPTRLVSSASAIWSWQFRIILVGDSTVGKSALLKRFTEGSFAETSDPTVRKLKTNYFLLIIIFDIKSLGVLIRFSVVRWQVVSVKTKGLKIAFLRN